MYTMIIADDEEIERKALSLLVQKEFPCITVVGLAENGTELLAMIESSRPDIAIVDINMPGISGIDAIDLLCSRGVDTRFVVNTAYSEFEYVQRALSLRVDAYILKPCKRADTIATIQKLCDSIEERRANSQSQKQIQDLFGKIQPVMESEIMYSIFISDPAKSSLATWCEMHAARWETGVMVALIPVDGNGGSLPTQEKNALRLFLHSVLASSCTSLITSTESSIHLLVFVSARDGAEEPRWRRWLCDVLQVLLDHIKRRFGVLMRAGVGGLYEDFGRMPDSYHESLLALRAPESGPIGFYSGSGQEGASSGALLKLARQLAEDVLAGRLHELSAHLEAGGAPLCQNETQQLWELLRREVLEAGHGGVELKAFFRLAKNALEQEQDRQKRKALLRESLCRLAQLLAGKNTVNAYVVEALQSIEEHYSRDISLDSVAAEIGISPFYLSRLLKAELGQTFVEYLTQVRIQEAVRLARTTRLSIKEIAERTGYQNPTYFCRVFKKHTGKTIGALREEGEHAYGV